MRQLDCGAVNWQTPSQRLGRLLHLQEEFIIFQTKWKPFLKKWTPKNDETHPKHAQTGQRSNLLLHHPRTVCVFLRVKADDDTMRLFMMTSPAVKWESVYASRGGKEEQLVCSSSC